MSETTRKGMKEIVVYKAPKPFGDGWFCLDMYTLTEDGFRIGKPTRFGDLESMNETGKAWLDKDNFDEEEFWNKVEDSYTAMKADKAFWEAELEERKA